MADPRQYKSDMSIEEAQREAQQTLRLFGQAVLHELDVETELGIEINGVSVSSIPCMDSALAELAAGWAFVHQFCVSPRDFDRATIHELRASVMVRGGIDILHRRGVLHGERFEQRSIPEPWPRTEDWFISEDVLLDILREAWSHFQRDRLLEGSIHAALASENGVKVVAFDITAQNAVAKVLGWALIQQHVPSYEIMVVNGIVTRAMVDAAVRLGVKIIASPNVPTADAYKLARISGMSIVGYMRNEIVGLFGNPGLVTFDDESDSNT